jgi:hypothetical protein
MVQENSERLWQKPLFRMDSMHALATSRPMWVINSYRRDLARLSMIEPPLAFRDSVDRGPSHRQVYIRSCNTTRAHQSAIQQILGQNFDLVLDALSALAG